MAVELSTDEFNMSFNWNIDIEQQHLENELYRWTIKKNKETIML